MLTNYQQIISDATGVTDPTDLEEIEEYMRECIWHPTLDWQTREQLASSAVVAWNECQFRRHTMNLQADPDDMNELRADRAQTAVDTHDEACLDYEDEETSIAELLCNLMHLCDRNGVDFVEQFHRARANYASETSREIQPPRVIAIVRGGLVSGAVSNIDGVDFSVLDHDNAAAGMDEQEQAEFDMLEAEANQLTAIY